MIKDRVIQKRIKGKVLAMAMTAVMASFFVPLRVEAAALELGDKTRGYQTEILNFQQRVIGILLQVRRRLRHVTRVRMAVLMKLKHQMVRQQLVLL